MECPIIDCHCHIYPEKIAERAVKGIGEFYDLPMAYDGKSTTMLKEGSEIGVCHYVIFSVATTPHQVRSINSFIAESVKTGGGKFTGLGTLHPDSENIIEDLHHIEELGLKGVKMHPDFQRFRIDDERLFPVYECISGKMPILLHTGDSRYDFSNPERMENVLKKFPELTVIGAHLGGWSLWKKAEEVLHGYNNFYVDCSSSFDWLSVKEAEEIIKGYGSERVLFGTDFPMWSYKDEISFFEKINLTEKEKENILYKNAEKLFGIKI